MSRSQPPLSPEVRALLDRERTVPPQPAAVRARALARARASLAAGGAVSKPPVRVRRIRWAAAAALACAASAAVAAGAYEIRLRLARPPSDRPVPAVAAPPVRPPVRSVPAAPVADAPAAEPARPIAAPRLSQAEALRAELRLLRPARAAVAREDFMAALPPIAAHARRFKDGRLAEEREALRVKALAGLGRTEEARRAAVAFRARFPRSVLLPAVSQMPASEP
jgi:hypothetical protein